MHMNPLDKNYLKFVGGGRPANREKNSASTWLHKEQPINTTRKNRADMGKGDQFEAYSHLSKQ